MPDKKARRANAQEAKLCDLAARKGFILVKSREAGDRYMLISRRGADGPARDATRNFDLSIADVEQLLAIAEQKKAELLDNVEAHLRNIAHIPIPDALRKLCDALSDCDEPLPRSIDQRRELPGLRATYSGLVKLVDDIDLLTEDATDLARAIQAHKSDLSQADRDA
jgi:hypothetical protein